jgi:hypothetical protein
MNNRLSSLVVLTARGLVLSTFCLGAAAVLADTAINAVPTTISTSGRYFLSMNLDMSNSSQSAITVGADDVTIDFQDHSITGTAGQGTNATGITATNHRNITVKNGSLNGFKIGIVFQRGSNTVNNNANNTVTNMRLSSNTFIGILIVDGSGCLVEQCQINRTGGTLSGVDAVGISLQSSSAVVRNNQISRVSAAYGSSFGIVSNASTAFLVDNQIEAALNGISVFNATGQTKYQRTLTVTVPNPFNGGTDAGDNN